VIEVSESEIREFLGLSDGETCYAVTGTDPFEFHLMTVPRGYEPGRMPDPRTHGGRPR
jgi:hypothetical protein